jgi:hypothetical protein
MLTGRNNNKSSNSDADLPLAVAALPFSVLHTGAQVNKATGALMAGRRPAAQPWRTASARDVAARLRGLEPWVVTETWAHIAAIFSGLVPVIVDGLVEPPPTEAEREICLPGVVDNVVALGCGSLAALEGGGFDFATVKRVETQHALVLTVRDALAARAVHRRARGWAAPEEVRCYAQDAAYQPADKGGLAEFGFTVLDDPRALLEVGNRSVVVSFAPDSPLRQIVADIARPAALIWPRVTDTDATNGVSR